MYHTETYRIFTFRHHVASICISLVMPRGR